MIRYLMLLAIVLVPTSSPGRALEAAKKDHLVLPARTVQVGSGVSAQLAPRLAKQRRHPLPVVVVVPAPLSAAGRAALAKVGCRLRQALDERSHLGLLDRDASLTELATLVTWLAPLEPVDHVESSIWSGRVEGWAHAGARLRILVRFYETVSTDEARTILSRWTTAARLHGPTGEWAAEIAPESVRALAAEEGVDWIEAGPHPMMPL